MNKSNLWSNASQSSLSGRAISLIFCALPGLAVLVFSSAILAQDVAPRPATENLLPETTVAFLQIDNVQETLPKLMGAQMLEDENIGPFVQRMYEEAEAVYNEATEGKVGMTLEQMKDLPAGEVCVAVIAPRRQDLEYLVAVDIDPESDAVETAVQARTELAKMLDEKGLAETVEATDSGLEIYSYDLPDTERKAHAFVRDGWFVSSTSRDELGGVLARWEGQEVENVRPLSQNRKFITIMNRCRAQDDVRPEVRFFLDPITMAERGFRGNTIAQGVMAFLPKVGLDGVLALGGSVSLQSDEFKSVFHGHVLLANPRSGIIEMLALKPGDSDPQPWMPADATNYVSTHWDPVKLINEFEKIVDTFSPKGEFQEKVVDKLQEISDFDFYKDIIDNVEGRFTYFEWADPETEYLLNARSKTISLGVIDSDKAKEVVDFVLEQRAIQTGRKVMTVEHEGVPMWVFDPIDEKTQKIIDERTKERVGDLPMRGNEPALCLLDSSLIMSNSVDTVKHLIDVSQGNSPALVDDEEYDRQMQKLIAAAGADEPCMVAFYNPEQPITELFKLLNDERSTTMVEKRWTEKNPMLGRFYAALADQPLPDFELIKRYFPPTGMIVTTDDTGYHVRAFQYGLDDE